MDDQVLLPRLCAYPYLGWVSNLGSCRRDVGLCLDGVGGVCGFSLCLVYESHHPVTQNLSGQYVVLTSDYETITVAPIVSDKSETCRGTVDF